MSASYTYRKADAFTSGGSSGNPAACLYLDADQRLTDEQMLEIAQAHKGFVSEMVYCRPRGDSFELVYYSSEGEVPFCGHGTIACLYALIAESPDLMARSEIVVETRRKGTIVVHNRIAVENAVLISAPDPIRLPVPVPVEAIADVLGVDPSAVDPRFPVSLIDAGNRTLVVPMATLSDNLGLAPVEEDLRAFTLRHGIDIVLAFSMETAAPTHRAHTRVFAAKYGYLEDPATGSGNCAFAYYLLDGGLWTGERILIEQGPGGSSFNTVHLRVQDGQLLFGGGATTRIDGTYYA